MRRREMKRPTLSLSAKQIREALHALDSLDPTTVAELAASETSRRHGTLYIQGHGTGTKLSDKTTTDEDMQGVLLVLHVCILETFSQTLKQTSLC